MTPCVSTTICTPQQEHDVSRQKSDAATSAHIDHQIPIDNDWNLADCDLAALRQQLNRWFDESGKFNEKKTEMNLVSTLEPTNRRQLEQIAPAARLRQVPEYSNEASITVSDKPAFT